MAIELCLPLFKPIRDCAWRSADGGLIKLRARLVQAGAARRDDPVRRPPAPCLTKSPTLTGVAMTRPATGGAMSVVSSAMNVPVSSKAAGTVRVTACAVVTVTFLGPHGSGGRGLVTGGTAGQE